MPHSPRLEGWGPRMQHTNPCPESHRKMGPKIRRHEPHNQSTGTRTAVPPTCGPRPPRPSNPRTCRPGQVSQNAERHKQDTADYSGAWRTSECPCTPSAFSYYLCVWRSGVEAAGPARLLAAVPCWHLARLREMPLAFGITPFRCLATVAVCTCPGAFDRARFGYCRGAPDRRVPSHCLRAESQLGRKRPKSAKKPKMPKSRLSPPCANCRAPWAQYSRARHR
jgi:hypothetical protein